jgi:peptide deformylase
MRSYGACGLSGPQIGLPWQIFVIEYTKEHMKTSHEVIRKIHEESIIPLTVFINPELKILDYTPVSYYENYSSECFRRKI